MSIAIPLVAAVWRFFIPHLGDAHNLVFGFD
jgi:hypothetical protein